MIVNVCPSGIAAAPAQQVWQVLTTPDRFGEWLDAAVVAVRPPGRAVAGQRIDLVAPSFGFHWRVSIDVDAVDPDGRWIDLTGRLPFGIVNHERVTLAQVDADQTLVRFN
jgi:ligand-binding SRPBCC domain-containing protein